MTNKNNIPEIFNSLADMEHSLEKIRKPENEPDNVLSKEVKENFIFSENNNILFIHKTIIVWVMLLLTTTLATAQELVEYTRPTWFYGIAGGANLNLYGGSTQHLNADFAPPVPFHAGKGIGLFVAPHIEYHRPDTRLGAMLEIGYDSRRGMFDQVISPCNCPADMKTNLNYISAEPSLRFAPFRSNLYFYAGPRFAYSYKKAFTYQLGKNPNYPNQLDNPEVKGDFSDTKPMLISGQIGAGYDIYLSSVKRHYQYVISPYISYQPYFGQSPRTTDTWTMTTLRVGAVIKIGRGTKIVKDIIAIATPAIKFSVNSPKNIPMDRRVRETVPLRNYIFFDLGSTEIPSRYILLKRDEVAEFRKTNLEISSEKRVSEKSKQDLTIYYNILNILGDRMINYPKSTVTLVGSSEKGEDDAKKMAGSVKEYLVSVFGIAPSRIAIEGRDKPKIPSEKVGGTKELELLREGDRRVSIESSSEELLEEFQTGPNASLKPIQIKTIQEAPVDSYITLNNEDAKDYSSWSVEVEDNKGTIQYFGPYTREKVAIPGKAILGDKKEGDYKISMIGIPRNGKEVRKDTTVHMVLWAPPVTDEGMRFSVIYEFHSSKAIAIYEDYLREVVTPKIPKNGTVILHGYTDIIGDEGHNLQLSRDRANDVKSILENSLAKAGRKDVKFEVYGFGEDINQSPYNNNYPEERFYNRTVMIDIIPAK